MATTRPETILADTAVAVHPDDERYRHLIGKTCLVPMLNRTIPVIHDTYVEHGVRHAARSRSPPATIPTTSRSASATACPSST